MAFQLNGNTPIRMPESIEPELNDIHSEKTARNALGDMLIDVINEKDKYGLTWKVIDFDTAHSILAMMPKEGFTMTYYDPDSGTEVTRDFYRGNRVLSIAYMDASGKPFYRSLRVSVIAR